MKNLSAFIFALLCAISIDAVACPGSVPNITGPDKVAANGSGTYVHNFDDGYRNSSGGYFGTQWSLVYNNGTPQVLSGNGTSINITFGAAGSYKVIAKDQFGSSGACYGCISNTTFEFPVTVCNLLPAPTALSATNVTPTSFTANWTAVAGATAYRVNFLRNNTTTTSITTPTNANSFTFNSAEPNSGFTYTVQTISCVPGAASSPSPSLATPNFPAPTVSLGGGDSDSRWFQWNAITGAADYVVQIAQNTNFSPLYENSSTPDTDYEFESTFCGTYYIRVAARSAGGTVGPFSATKTSPKGAGCARASTAILQDPLTVEEGDGLVGAYPNPSDRFFNVRIPSAFNVDKINVAVRNVSGITVKLPFSMKQRTMEIDAATATSGVYILAISDGKNVLTVKAAKK